MKNKFAFLLLSLGLVILLLLSYIVYKNDDKVTTSKEKLADTHVCGLDCGALDPVTDPIYNIKQIIKESILCEEHIAIPRKRCIQCIFKHLYHCQALAEEGIWLATKHIDEYPLLLESADFYDQMIKQFSHAKTDEDNLQDILEKMREHRKNLVDKYVLSEDL